MPTQQQHPWESPSVSGVQTDGMLWENPLENANPLSIKANTFPCHAATLGTAPFSPVPLSETPI